MNYGKAAITASIARLDQLGIPHTGAGANATAARAPVVLERDGLKVGFLQRTSVYWSTSHEAGENSAGVAVIRGNTAYQLPLHKTRREVPSANRPGIPLEIITWADPHYLQRFRDDIADLRKQADIVVASCHWGLWCDVLQYMTDIGHGPHFSLPVEIYKGKPIFYGLGSFSFHTGHHDGVAVGDWVGMLARITLEDGGVTGAAFRFVRHNAGNETVPCALADEQATLADIAERSAAYGTGFEPEGDDVQVILRS